MADNNISIKIQADANAAKAELRELINQVRESGRAATYAEKEAITAAKARVRETRNVIRAEKDLGTIGIRSTREVKAEMDKLNAALARLKKSSTATSQDVFRASQQVKGKLQELQAELGNVEKKTGGLSLSWQKLVGVWAAFQGAMAAGGLIAAIEEMDRLDARLKISEGSAKAAATAMDEIKRVATDTRAPVKDVADAYIRFSTSIQRAGGSQKQSIQFTELLSKALKVSGASATQVGNTMMQLGQAFQSGALQGDEFRSVAENGGMVLNYLADALGVTRGQLKKMSADGELTAEKLLKLVDAADQINKDFAKVPKTAGEAFVLVSNAFIDVLSKSTALKVVIMALGEVLTFAARNMGELVSTAIIAGLTALIISAGGISAAFTAATAAVVSLRVALLSLMASNPWLLAFSAAAAVIIWQWDAIKKAIVYVMDLLGMTPETVVIDRTTEAVAELERQIREMQGKLGPALDAVKQKIDEQRKAATESTKAITSAYQSMAGQIDANATDQINAIKARYAEEKRLIAETKGDSDARYAAESQALITATQQQIEILKDAARQKTELIDQEYTIAAMATSVMYDNERERANALQTLDNEVMQKKRTVLAQMLSDYRSHIDALNGEAERNFQAVKAIEEQKRGLSMSTQERIRSLQQSAMGEYAAYQDKLKQIDELNAKARDAISKGQSEQAVEYAKKAQEVAAGIASGVKENGKEIVSQANATATAIGKISESESIAQSALDETMRKRQQAGEMQQQQAQEFATSMSTMEQQLGATTARLNEGLEFTIETNVEQVLADVQALEGFIQQREMLLVVQSNLDELQDQVADMKLELEEGTFSVHDIEDNAAEVQRAIDKLKRPTSSIHTIYEKRVPMNSNGGLIQGYATGGQVWKRIMGKVNGPGTGTSDSVFARLSNGEFVIKAAMVRKWGAGFFAALNSGFMPPMPRFATGGLNAIMPSQPGSSESLTVTFRAGDIEAPVRITDRNSRESMKAFARELSKIQLVTG